MHGLHAKRPSWERSRSFGLPRGAREPMSVSLDPSGPFASRSRQSTAVSGSTPGNDRMGQPANLMRIANALQQGRDRLLQNRMTEVGGQFGEWNQDEPAKMQARMGEDQPMLARLFHNLVAVE